LVGPSTVLTAAHCVYNPRIQHNFLPASLHFLIGYTGDLHGGHAVGVEVAIGADYNPNRPIETMGSDWALVSLDKGFGSADRILPMIGKTQRLQAP